MEQLLRMYESDEVVRHWHEQAKFKVRRAARPDYYAAVGVASRASEAVRPSVRPSVLPSVRPSVQRRLQSWTN
jgi:hypothetical protein